MYSGGVGIFKDIYTTNKSDLFKAFGVLSNNVSAIAFSIFFLHFCIHCMSSYLGTATSLDGFIIEVISEN